MKQMTEEKKASLLTLFLTFAKIGSMTFGGGYAMLPILQREIVENHGWCTDEDLADYFAIGQCTPGIIAVNTSTFIGYRQRGVIGGIVATIGFVFPSFIIIMALAGLIAKFSDNLYVQKAFAGIRACVVVLILNAIIKLWKSAIKGKLTLCIFLAVLALSILLNLSPILIVVVCALLGIVLEMIQTKAGKEGSA